MTPKDRAIYDQGIDAALGALREFRSAFPEKIFSPIPKLFWPALEAFMESNGFTLDGLSADHFRRAIDSAIEQVENEKTLEPF